MALQLHVKSRIDTGCYAKFLKVFWQGILLRNRLKLDGFLKIDSALRTTDDFYLFTGPDFFPL